jgi:glycerol-3-phosphate dehydrogenase (NAD(P)+)
VKAAVLGAGSWGTTFAQVLCDAGTPAVLCCRRPEIADAINRQHENPGRLPGVPLPPALTATCDPAEALAGTDLVVLAVPAQSLRANLAAWAGAGLLPPGALLVSLMKGVELDTCARMRDVIGCELGGAVKNVIALAVGIAIGMGLGDNTRAMLMTRGLAEISRLGEALGADQLTLSGLAGLGDLAASCSSPLSRNRSVGEALGRGTPLDEVLASTTETAEGVKSSQSIRELARKHGVEMPITEVIAAVLHEGLAVGQAALLLAGRPATRER